MRSLNYLSILDSNQEGIPISLKHLKSVPGVQMVKAGICCTIAAEITWFDEESREFVVKPIEDIQRSRTIYARIPDEATPSQATWEFFEFLKSVKPRFFDTK